ncbi:DUF803-domain-containing protein [Sistotremastrum niveocremeum HHB9708]|uniref:DUF803-domain-containing protein n=1 Tax=Sistotremastrum niveocremeum HHB9708 TaxID=1314777 RepID=A0A165A5L3_9AGAM|nr:DUF803-domain-containing protein [Sistotremastrum niveocremeum HHB9708]
MSSSSASPSASAASSATAPHQYRVIGIVLAIASGLFIGTSFVLKKKGLLRSQKGHAAGEGVAYLKSPMWWSGMTLMILGELLNLGAYSFVEAILVTPLGALSVVICAILSHFFLKEKLSLFGWIGCTQCILGSVIIAMNAPNEQSVSTIAAFKKFFLAPWFLAYGSVLIAAALIVIFFIAPKYGTKSMLWYILVCSLFGGLSVSCTQALGASILTTIRGQNQFKNWFIYFLIAFVICTLLTELFFLNKALALFNTAMVTPTYYVMFTFCTLCTSIILYEGLKSSGAQIMTMVLGFCVICTGIFILQMSKVDPRQLTVDPKTSMLLQAARSEVEPAGAGEENDLEKEVKATEEPGMDALRGTLGAIGSVIRARRRKTITERSVNGDRQLDDAASANGQGLSEKEPGLHRQSSGSPSVAKPDERARHSLPGNGQVTNGSPRPVNDNYFSGTAAAFSSSPMSTPTSMPRSPSANLAKSSPYPSERDVTRPDSPEAAKVHFNPPAPPPRLHSTNGGATAGVPTTSTAEDENQSAESHR